MERSTAQAALPYQHRRPLPLQSKPPYTKVLYTPEEAAELLSISRSRLYILLARTAILSIKEGRARLVPAAALDQYVQRRIAEQLPLTVIAESLGTMHSRGRQG